MSEKEEEVLSAELRSRIKGRRLRLERRADDLVKRGRADSQRHARDIVAADLLLERARRQSLIDPLTNLYNRRGFSRRAPEQLELARRLKTTALLIFLDFNHFKEINDNLGHHVGDQALREVADILRETFRKTDVIARSGGDEFAVLAIETEEDKAKAKEEKKDNLAVIEDRLKKNIEAHNRREDRQYQLSLSIGILRYDPQNPCSIDELLQRADKLMYGQKRTGQGRE